MHVGGTFEEIARGEADVNAGRHPERPYCLVTQPCVVDPTQGPPGRHTLWAYCHVPNGSHVDMTERIEATDRAVRTWLSRPGPRPLDLHRARRGGAQPELRRRRHQRGRGHPPSDGLPPHGAVEPIPHRPQGRLLVLGRNPAGRRRPRHVRARRRPRRPARPGPPWNPDPGSVMARTTSYAWYRLRTTLGSERSYYISVIVLVATLGGLSMGAVAAARSTESSFSDLVSSSHVPDLFVLDGVINPAIGLDSAYNPVLLRKLAHLQHVERVADDVSSTSAHSPPRVDRCRPAMASRETPASTGCTSARIPWPSRRDGWRILTRRASSSSMRRLPRHSAITWGRRFPSGG